MLTSNILYRFAQILTIIIVPAGLAALWFVKIEDRVRVSGVVTSPQQAVATSPFKETVVETVHVQVGDAVTTGTPLVTLTDLADVRAQTNRLKLVLARIDDQLAALKLDATPPASAVVDLRQEKERLDELLALKKRLDQPYPANGATLPSTLHAEIAERRQREAHLRKELERIKTLVARQLKPKQSVEELTYQVEQAVIQSRRAELGLTEEREAVDQRVAASRRRIEELGGVLEREHERLAHERDDTVQTMTRLERELERMIVRAPFDGTVVEVSADESEAVSVGSPLVEISGSRAKIIKTRVPESRMLEVQVGQPVIIRSSLYNFLKYDVYRGVVTHIAPHGMVEADRVFYDVTITIEEGAEILKVGSAASCEILVGAQPVFNLLIRRR